MIAARIVIVDDEVIIARELESRLSNLGYEVLGTAATGPEAIRLVEQMEPNLVLMDIVLRGGMDGIETASELRKRWGVPVIYLSAYTDDATLARARETHPFGYIVKPFSERELHANIEMALYKHDVEGQIRTIEERLRQAQKMEAIGQMAGGVAHDFNNLLTIISGYSSLLLGRLPTDDPNRELVLEVYKAGEQAAVLTKQLLAFSRKQALEPRITDLNAIVHDTERLLHRLIGEDVELMCTLAEDLPAVKVDPGQLEQVIMNLAVNARDAMPQGGKMTLETSAVELDQSYAETHPGAGPGRYVQLAMSDTGTGMNEATRVRIFEPFFTTKEPGKGTGLGLSTVYGIVHQSGGHIWVYSELGRGTTFKIYLPVASGAAQPASQAPGGGTALTGDESILVVEDEEGVRGLARMALQLHGYRVLEATRGSEAIRLAEELDEPIHLVLTDVVMPEMSGREAAEKIVAVRPEARILFMSGYPDDAVVRHGLLLGKVSFLQKPFTPSALLRKVREVLDRQEKEEPEGGEEPPLPVA